VAAAKRVSILNGTLAALAQVPFALPRAWKYRNGGQINKKSSCR